MADFKPPVVMTIAGSDPSGGAGIQVVIFDFVNFSPNIDQADLKTFTSLQCYGTSVITALTAQNTIGVDAIHTVPPQFVEQQVRLLRSICYYGHAE